METESLTVDAEEQAMRDIGHEADVAQGRPAEESSAAPPEPRAPGQEEPKQETRPSDVEVPEQKPDSSQTEPKEPAPPKPLGRDPVTGKFQKPETEYAKAQKEAERKERSWQALQAEKEQVRRERFQWQEQLRLQQLETARQTFAPLKKDGLTAKEYYDGARVFKQNGDYEKAFEATEIANELWQAEQGRVGQMQQVEAEYQWRMGMNEAIRENPEIAKPGSPISGHLERIIEQNPWIYQVPQGFQRAAEVADMLVKMDSIRELQDENVELRAQLEKFQRKSQPTKGGYAAPRTGQKDFDDMSLDEMEAHLQQVTAEADGYR